VNGPVGASGASLEGLSLGVSGAGITLIFNGGETNAQVTFEVSATGNSDGSGDPVNTSTVRAAGALMDDELATASPTFAGVSAAGISADIVNIGNVIKFTSGMTAASIVTTVNGVSGDVTISGSSEEDFTTALKNKLDAIEASADVTDATNVTSAGALMDSELTSIADVKALNQSVVTSAHPTFAGVSAAGVSANFVDIGDQIKFTSGMTAASIVTTVNGVSGDVTLVVTDQNFTDDDHTKLNGIEASADVTDATNVAAAGALMDSELSSIADVKALDQSVVSGASPTFGTANFTDASNKRLMTDAQESKLDGIEASADVTDATNVAAAGALMDSELASIADVKALDQSVVSGASPTFAATNFTGITHTDENFTAADHTKLNGIEASADVTDATNVASAGALMDSELASIADVKALDQSVVSGASPTFAATNFTGITHTDENFTAADHTKLNGIEASADVTDATNVAAAGALMDSELSSIADVKALDQSVVSGASPTFGTANFTDASNKRLMTDAQESKLDGVEASADVTDATNVAAAGALMDSELTSIADVKALNQSVVTTAHPTFAGVSAAGVSANFVDVGDQIKFTSGMTAASIVTTVNGVSGDVTISGISDENFTTALKNKLDGIEASADVTDATNVTSAGALMDSELSSIADVKALDQSVISGASPTFGTANFTDASNKRLMTDAQESKLDGIEASADVTDATNVTSAGALMDSELTSIADVKALNQSVVTSANPTFAGVSAAGVSADIVDVGNMIKFTSGMTAASIVTTVNGASGDVTISGGTVTSSYSGHLESAIVKTYYLDPRVPVGRTVTEFYAICGTGGCSAVIAGQNGTISTISVSPTGATGSLANTTLPVGGTLDMTLSSVVGCFDLRFAVRYTQ
jgi:chorismate mutase